MSGDVTIRALASQADYAACVDLQRDTWGRNFTDAVPASILMVAQKVGGVAAGAFAADGALLGFVFGLTGVENGEIVHWSDMLAVRPDAQNLGLGRRLKDFQRRAVAAAGGKRIYWTYDPLQARNAHLNFNVFGVSVVRYVRDMYGSDTGSDLHRGIGTDRFVVAWLVDDRALEARRRGIAETLTSNAFDHAGVEGDIDPSRHTAPTGDRRRIAVPLDITDMLKRDPQRAADWRASTRKAFERAFGDGFIVDGFRLGDERGFYLLSRHTS